MSDIKQLKLENKLQDVINKLKLFGIEVEYEKRTGNAACLKINQANQEQLKTLCDKGYIQLKKNDENKIISVKLKLLNTPIEAKNIPSQAANNPDSDSESSSDDESSSSYGSSQCYETDSALSDSESYNSNTSLTYLKSIPNLTEASQDSALLDLKKIFSEKYANELKEKVAEKNTILEIINTLIEKFIPKQITIIDKDFVLALPGSAAAKNGKHIARIHGIIITDSDGNNAFIDFTIKNNHKGLTTITVDNMAKLKADPTLKKIEQWLTNIRQATFKKLSLCPNLQDVIRRIKSNMFAFEKKPNGHSPSFRLSENIRFMGWYPLPLGHNYNITVGNSTFRLTAENKIEFISPSASTSQSNHSTPSFKSLL